MPSVLAIASFVTLEAVIVGYSDEHRRLAESLSPRVLEVVEMNLEDAFIEYTRGPRRAFRNARAW